MDTTNANSLSLLRVSTVSTSESITSSTSSSSSSLVSSSNSSTTSVTHSASDSNSANDSLSASLPSPEPVSSPFLIDYEPNSALFFATMTGDIEAAIVALEKGASPNYRNSNSLTPLHIACGGVGPLPMIDLLLKAGADVNAVDASGWTPLLLVSSTGQIPLLNRLLEEIPKINLHHCMNSNDKNWYPLTRAAFRGQAKTVERLLEEGADLSRSITEGKTAEEWAQIHNHTEVIETIQRHRRLSNSHPHPSFTKTTLQ